MTAAAWILRSVSAAAVAGALAACTYTGSDHPVARRLSWFSYVAGDDIRRECRAEAPDRYRFVYNGVYIQQVRAYDVTAKPLAGANGHRLRVRVLGPPDLSQVFLGEPADIFAPWRGRSAEVRLGDVDLARLRQTMVEAGVFERPPGGLELPSEEFHWTVAACLEGRFHFNAYLWPSARFDGARFAGLLLAWDPTAVPVNQPRRLTVFDLYGETRPEARTPFNLRVGENGLIGARPWF